MNLLEQYSLPKYSDPYGSISTPTISSGLQSVEEYNYTTAVAFQPTNTDTSNWINPNTGLIILLIVAATYITVLLSRIHVMQHLIEQQKDIIQSLNNLLNKNIKDG